MNNRSYFFRWRFIFWLGVMVVLGSACDLIGGGETPPAVVEPTVAAATATAEIQPPTTIPDLPTTAPTATAADIAPTSTIEGESEPEEPTVEAATATAEPPSTAEPTLEETAAPTLEPVVAAPGTIAPGQQISNSLESGEVQVYQFQGTEFEPVMVFVEGDEELDIAINAYLGSVAADTPLSQLTPLSQANVSPVGRPEVLVVTPDEDGEHTIVVRGHGNTAGTYTLYMYDGTTPTSNTQLISDSFEAGESKSYPAQSNGGRPVIAYVDQTVQCDMVIQIVSSAGEVMMDANFGGSNSAEAAFVLPLETTDYTVELSTLNGEAAVYNLVIVTLN
jgi:hypothetical protein